MLNILSFIFIYYLKLFQKIYNKDILLHKDNLLYIYKNINVIMILLQLYIICFI